MKLKAYILVSALLGLLLSFAALFGGLKFAAGASAAPLYHSVCLGGACDFTTIQAAVDAASPGDEVRVSAEEYEEHLTITKALTLSGGWDAGFASQAGQTVLSNPDAVHPIGHGRMITASAETISDVITIDHFSVLNGNASVPSGPVTATAAEPEAVYFRSPLALDAEPDVLPAPSDPAQTRQSAQAARLESLLPLRGPRDLQPPALVPTMLKPTRGGGLFITNASLRLLHSHFFYNVASDLNAGAGGAVAAEDVGTVEVRDCIFAWNTASSRYWGYGGGLYISYAAPGGVVVADSQFISNQAGFASDPTTKDSESTGGGMTASAARGIQVKNNLFQGNLASFYGTLGAGGGLMLLSTRDALVSGNTFEANTSLARNRPEQTNDLGSGGGAEINLSTGSVVEDNLFRANVAGVFMSGWGGGLSMNTSQGILVQRNTFDENWAAFRTPEQLLAYHNSGGGGLFLNTDIDARVLSNTFTSNQAAFWQAPGRGYFASGGGLFAEQGINNLLASGNVFSSNLASGGGLGLGGALAVEYSKDDAVTLRHNQFINNRASTSGTGRGGAVFVTIDFATLDSNLFQGNIASQQGDGYGGGAAFDAMRSVLPPQQVDLLANRFVDNHAQGDGGGTGGGVYLRGRGGFSLENNVLAGNSARLGGGAALSGELASQAVIRSAANNTLVANQSQGIWFAGWPTATTRLVNNIIVSHTLGISVGQAVSQVQTGPLLVDNTLFFHNDQDLSGTPYTLTRVITGDPLFVQPAAGDYHLQKASRARDTGCSCPPAPSIDADGLPRPFGLAWDLGAFEWRQWLTRLPFLPLRLVPVVFR